MPKTSGVGTSPVRVRPFVRQFPWAVLPGGRDWGLLRPPAVTQWCAPWGPQHLPAAGRRYRLENLKKLARNLDVMLNEIWAEIADLEETEERANPAQAPTRP